MTLGDLAEKVFADRADPRSKSAEGEISRFENGNIANPQARTVQRYANALGITQDEIEALRQQTDPDPAKVETLRAGSEGKARELHLTEQLFIGLARRIAADLDNIDDAHRELEAAVTRAADLQQQAKLPSNLGEQIDRVLKEVARLNAGDDLEAATALIEAELAEADAHKSRLLTLATDQALLSRDTQAAARHLIARADLDAGGRASFNALRKLQTEWNDRGRDKGLNLDLEVSIALAEQILPRATDPDQRGAALNDLGISLGERGQRDATAERLEQAVEAFRAALQEHTQDRVPLDWAMTQNNLGNALSALGERSGDTKRLEQAVTAYRAALQERTQDRVPLDWATTQNNLGVALRALGERSGDTDRLEQAVTAYHAALQERTQDRVPLDWAGTTVNLAYTLALIAGPKDDLDGLRAARAMAVAARKVLVDGGHVPWAENAERVIAQIDAMIAARDG